MSWKSYAAVSGAGLVVTYLFSAPPALGPQRTSSARPAAVTAAQQAAVDIQEQAERLQAHLPHSPEYREPSRNPFRFAARPPVARPPAADPPIIESPIVEPEPVPQPPLVRLSGIATDVVDGVRVRRAILITEWGVLNVGEGDAVGADYRVARIDAEAVELVDRDGTPRHLRLRP